MAIDRVNRVADYAQGRKRVEGAKHRVTGPVGFRFDPVETRDRDTRLTA